MENIIYKQLVNFKIMNFKLLYITPGMTQRDDPA